MLINNITIVQFSQFSRNIFNFSIVSAAPLGRSGTGGLERGAMRRSVSASRGGHGNVMSSSVHNPASSSSSNNSNKLVKKSRPVQTSLTKDPCHDTPDTDNPGLVNFQVWQRNILNYKFDQIGRCTKYQMLVFVATD